MAILGLFAFLVFFRLFIVINIVFYGFFGGFSFLGKEQNIVRGKGFHIVKNDSSE